MFKCSFKQIFTFVSRACYLTFILYPLLCRLELGGSETENIVCLLSSTSRAPSIHGRCFSAWCVLATVEPRLQYRTAECEPLMLVSDGHYRVIITVGIDPTRVVCEKLLSRA